MSRSFLKVWRLHNFIKRWCQIAIFSSYIVKVFPIRNWPKKSVVQLRETNFHVPVYILDEWILLFNVQWATIFRHDVWCLKNLAAAVMMWPVVNSCRWFYRDLCLGFSLNFWPYFGTYHLVLFKSYTSPKNFRVWISEFFVTCIPCEPLSFSWYFYLFSYLWANFKKKNAFVKPYCWSLLLYVASEFNN